MYTHFPYCVKHLGNKNYIILNRDYKPLGTTDWIDDYASHPSVQNINITKKIAMELSFKNSDDLESIYLFESTPKTLADKKLFTDYLNRLGKLAKLNARSKKDKK